MASHTQVVAQVLKRGAPEDDNDPFEEVLVAIETQKDNPLTVMEKAGVQRGFMCYFGRVCDENVPVKTWYDGKEPMVIVPVNSDYIEATEVRGQDSAARLVDAGVPISHALKALGRAHWHRGFHEFSGAATNARKLVEATCRDPYNNRTELVTLDPFGELGPTGHYRENVPPSEADVLLPPHCVGHLDPLQVKGQWAGRHDFRGLSGEERLDLKQKGHEWADRKEFTEKAGRAVVRVFGYHELEGEGLRRPPRLGRADRAPRNPLDELRVDDSDACYRVVPFTAFFVSPTLLLATRTCCYSAKEGTYASHFRWTSQVRAKHSTLRPGVDLHACKEVQGVSSFLVEKIRNIGVELTTDKVPPGNMAVAWNDLLLLEVEEGLASSMYLLPEDTPIKKGEDLASVYYSELPDDSWIEGVMGPQGHGVDMGLRDLLDLCWGFNIKSLSLGTAKNDDEVGLAHHSCALVTGSTGSPVLHNFKAVSTPECPEIYTFAAINCGRCREEVEQSVTDIEANNSTPAAAKMAKSLNMYNTAISVTHIAFILLYQQYILPEFAGKPEESYLEKLLAPYAVFVKSDVLRACHRKMLKDAEDHNCWGMAFWERHDTQSALYCFREGARMFCIATIPNMSQLEIKLKDALQSNVSAVVMSVLENRECG